VPGGGAATTIPNVSDAAHCPATGDAWYYDDPAAPSRVLLCPATCATASADAGSHVEVVLGCPTTKLP
jgi:hypothetical protein